MNQVMDRTEAEGVGRSAIVPAATTVRSTSVQSIEDIVDGLKDRLKQKRDELRLSQLDVARQIVFWNNKQHEHKRLSRSAYCMYESGEVVPDLTKIVLLAAVLQCEPQWLAFGLGERSTVTPDAVEEVDYDTASGEWKSVKSWTLDNEWVQSRFDTAPNTIALYTVNDFSHNLKPGDIAVIRPGLEPTQSHAEYVFAMNDESTVASVTRPHRGGPYRVYDAARKGYTEVEPGDLHILGKVVGKLSDF